MLLASLEEGSGPIETPMRSQVPVKMGCPTLGSVKQQRAKFCCKRLLRSIA